MKLFELIGEVDEQHRLHAEVPTELPVGPVRIVLLLPDEDDAGGAWSDGIAKEWLSDLGDGTQDLYTVKDGSPTHVQEPNYSRPSESW